VPYLNFHRPCHFPEKTIGENGKITIRYPYSQCMTPYHKLRSLPDWESYLRSGVTSESLEVCAMEKTPLQAAKEKKKARDALMKVVLPKLSDTMPLTITTQKDDFRVFFE